MLRMVKGKSRVWIIDDSETDRLIAEKTIGYTARETHCSSFDSAIKALEMLREINSDSDELPDLILLDISMPNMNGYEFLDAYKQLPSPNNEVSVYILSSSGSIKDKEMARQYKEVVGYLEKPLMPNDVQRIIA